MGGLRNAQIMHTAPVGGTKKEDREEGMHEQDIFDRVVFLLPAINLLSAPLWLPVASRNVL